MVDMLSFLLGLINCIVQCTVIYTRKKNSKNILTRTKLLVIHRLYLALTLSSVSNWLTIGSSTMILQLWFWHEINSEPSLIFTVKYWDQQSLQNMWLQLKLTIHWKYFTISCYSCFFTQHVYYLYTASIPNLRRNMMINKVCAWMHVYIAHTKACVRDVAIFTCIGSVYISIAFNFLLYKNKTYNRWVFSVTCEAFAVVCTCACCWGGRYLLKWIQNVDFLKKFVLIIKKLRK